ncbi:MAG: endo-1,4-beta-xylanase [Coleofasciculaceae cyanobacterium SM2_1_6]|nr:endo-1,4-beta-xylanase [Coleofasciculaceae cyanobacterium SM2_1_6]
MKVKFFLGLIFLFFLPIFFAFTLGQIPEAPASSPTLENTGVSLRQLAAQRGIQIGAAVNTYPLRSDRTYQQLLAREFNVVVPENAMKFELVHPQQDRFNFQEMDEIIAFAETHQMEFRHHPLVWDEQLPAWLVRGDFTRAELMDILKQHIQTIVKRYRGKVKTIDVVNEGIARDGTLRDTLWLRGLGPEYIDLSLFGRTKPTRRQSYFLMNLAPKKWEQNPTLFIISSKAYSSEACQFMGSVCKCTRL